MVVLPSDPDWASCTIGVFLCKDCAGVHRALGSSQSRIKSIKLDNWDKDQVQVMEMIGNVKARDTYELCVPEFYSKPFPGTVDVLRKEWILAKYQRLEFSDPDNQSSYNCATKQGLLWKLGRDRKQFAQRKFVLSRAENKLYYYVNEENGKNKQPKAEADLDFVNAVFVPEKIGNPYGLQITYFKNGSTRNLFVYSESSKDIVDWYMCIRAAKWERRRIAFPDRDLVQLAEDLTKDFLLEGWLHKMGPKNEPFRRRWFTLDRRKLMYFEEQLNAFAKGEVFIGHKDAGYSVSTGEEEGNRGSNSQTSGSSYCFTLHTPDRDFVMRAETQEDMEKWVLALQRVVEMPLTPQDSKLAALLVPKKSSNSFRLIKR
ncbi:arf-GAP with dual PH domain-containing protein 1 isoform X2 [Aplysia californica]|uniref:Arf-GAP with dual PH domain-containing protein 1 isoform X2 n=1 Tax=Aplysia californica TaxID=6500 RepID=A0ABM0JG94_APLCA|nr:arf-GAP with dual PH domain-containing protein 1 isoform X2 [Aplysia californica]